MIERKKKYCKECKNLRYIYGHGLCSYCYNKAQAKKQNKHPYKPVEGLSNKSGCKIPVRKRKPPSGLVHKITSFGFKSQVEWMEYQDDNWRDAKGELWCYLTGRKMKYKKGDDMWYSCFAHVLPKGLYPLFKLYPQNCRVLHPEVHTLVDNYKAEYREMYPEIDFDKWFSLQEDMKKKYDEFKKLYLL